MRCIRLMVIGAILAAVVGCGGSGERGKNQDLDRPSKPTEKK